MAKENPIDKQVQTAIALGQSNQQLLPAVKNWCRHIVLEDVSGGYVAQIYRLPITIHISCPHAAGRIQGAMLESIAEHFITENCSNCPHHDPVIDDNFGTQVLVKQKLQKAEDEKAFLAEKALKEALRKEITALAQKEKPKAGITQLSVLKYVDALEQSQVRLDNAKLLVEAAKVEPGFFNMVALQGIAYYFDDEVAGIYLLEAVATVLESTADRPSFVLDRAFETLNKFRHLNAVCLLLKKYIGPNNLGDHEKNIQLVIGQCRYERYFEAFSRAKTDYSGALEFLSHLIGQDAAFMMNLFRDLLCLLEKNTRINTHYLLQQLFPLQSRFVVSLAPEIVQSMEGEDDPYMDSADRSNLKTIALLIKSDPTTQYPIIQSLFARLSRKAMAATVDLTGIILSDDSFRNANHSFCQQLIDTFVYSAFGEVLADKKDELQKLLDLSQDFPKFFESHFTGLLGMLIKAYDEQAAFYHYREEVKTKPPDQHTTFNYLTRKQSWEILNVDTALNSILHTISAAIESVIKHDPAKHGLAAGQLLKSLDSTTQEQKKTALIIIVSKAVKDPLVLIRLLPDLYTYLLDPNSAKVRHASIDWLDNIMDRFPNLITQTLLDLLEIFSEDSDVIVKAKSIRLLETLSKKMPDQFTKNHVELIIESLLNQYVGVHKSAAKICHIIFDQISVEQRRLVFNSLTILADYYREKDPSFCKEIVEQLLCVSADYPKLLDYVVKTYVIPNCRHQDYYIAEDFREILDQISGDYPVFEQAWLEVALEFLGKTHMQLGDGRERGDLFNKILNLSYKTVQGAMPLFDKFIRTRQASDQADILCTLDVLSYFELHSMVKEICDHLLATIPDLGSTKDMLVRCKLRLAFSVYDESCRNGSAEKKQLQIIDYALQKV